VLSGRLAPRILRFAGARIAACAGIVPARRPQTPYRRRVRPQSRAIAPRGKRASDHARRREIVAYRGLPMPR